MMWKYCGPSIDGMYEGPRSYTREDIVEIHCHGGMIPIRRILELTIDHGARLAEPGEFTKRAFKWQIRPYTGRSSGRSHMCKIG